MNPLCPSPQFTKLRQTLDTHRTECPMKASSADAHGWFLLGAMLQADLPRTPLLLAAAGRLRELSICLVFPGCYAECVPGECQGGLRLRKTNSLATKESLRLRAVLRVACFGDPHSHRKRWSVFGPAGSYSVSQCNRSAELGGWVTVTINLAFASEQ